MHGLFVRLAGWFFKLNYLRIRVQEHKHGRNRFVCR